MAVQRRTVGSVVEIPVDDYVVHAQILAETEIVVFDTKGLSEVSVGSILSREPAAARYFDSGKSVGVPLEWIFS